VAIPQSSKNRVPAVICSAMDSDWVAAFDIVPALVRSMSLRDGPASWLPGR
jgi:hypothetical protein